MASIIFAVIDDDLKEISRIVYILRDVSIKYDVDFHIYSPKSDIDLQETLLEVETGNFSGIIIDQMLGDHSNITLKGIDVAKRLRIMWESMPIFILTKYIEDDLLLKYGFSIDDAISKSHIIDYPESFLGRLLRSSKRYIVIQKEIKDEMNQLISTSYERSLTSEENSRLIELKFKITPTGIIEGAQNDPHSKVDDDLDEKISKALEILKRIEELQN